MSLAPSERRTRASFGSGYDADGVWQRDGKIKALRAHSTFVDRGARPSIVYVHYGVRAGQARHPGRPGVLEGSILNSALSSSSHGKPPHHFAIVILAILSIIVPTLPRSVGASEQQRIVALGESNNEVQRGEVLGFLQATDSDQFVTVTVDETVRSMEGVFDVSGVDTAYSSTSLTCPAKGSGIDVMTRNIEIIPPELYALALLTAGMSDVQLAVAAPNDAPALGMTAMTGVFKTWEMEPCSDSGSDPLRRQLALEELALIADIGQEPGAVRQTTLVVLDAQREIIGKQITADELDAIVTARSEAAGLDLNGEDQAEIVDFLSRLSRAEINWGPYTSGWSTRYSEDGSGVVLAANQDTSNDGSTGFPGMVINPVADALRRWWLPIALVGALLLLGIFRARHLARSGR